MFCLFQEDLKSGPPLRKWKSKKRFPVLFGAVDAQIKTKCADK